MNVLGKSGIGFVLALWCCGLPLGTDWRGAAQPSKELSPEQRQALTQQAGGLQREARQWHERGDHKNAITLMQQAYKLVQQLYPMDQYPQGHVFLAVALGDLGTFHTAQREFDAAQSYYEQALKMYQALYPQDKYPEGHANLANALNSLGTLFWAQREYGKAAFWYEQTLKMRRQLYPPAKFPNGHPDLAQSLANLAVLHHHQATWARALPYCREALTMRQQLYPPGKHRDAHPELAESLHLLAVVLQEQGEYNQALPYYEQALKVCQALYPPQKYPQGHSYLAMTLQDIGTLYKQQGEYGKALGYLEQALKMKRQLFPVEKYRDGHPDIAATLNNIGGLRNSLGEFHKALAHLEEGLAMRRALYPPDQYPQGHPDLTHSLNNLGALYWAQGECGKGLHYFNEALKMKRQLFPVEQYPQGHPELATGLYNLGALLQQQGEYAKALPHYQQALAMWEALYPPDKYPRGHPELAGALNNLATLLEKHGESAKALACLQQALAMKRLLYPSNEYPQGHPDLAMGLMNLGSQLDYQKDYAAGRSHHEQALKMYRQLYPTDKYPQGHPSLATSMSNLAFALRNEGKNDQSLAYYEQALKMYDQLYPRNLFPQGHPNLAGSRYNLGCLLLAQGNYRRAMEQAEFVVRMYQDLFRNLAIHASEAELLNFAAQCPDAQHLLLSAARHLEQSDATVYDQLWRGKGGLARVLESRQKLLQLQSRDPEVQQLAQKLGDTRRQLARLLLVGSADLRQGERLQELTRAKEALERELAAKVPAVQRLQELDRQGPADLSRLLPPRSVFIDIYRYQRHDTAPAVGVSHYVAFVLAKGRPAVRVELGSVESIDRALTDWRREIAGQQRGQAAATLRRLVWDPLTARLPTETETVWLAPDGLLTALPWAALPGREDGTILLEDYALAVVPHGPFLLDHLAPDLAQGATTGGLLLVGGVQYHQEPKSFQRLEDRVVLRGQEAITSRPIWAALPGTLNEMKRITELAGKRPVLSRSGTEAGTQQLLADLCEPKQPPRWLHMATHGFFADRRFRSAFRVDERAFEYLGRERATPGARNPLVLSGLVLAGANLPAKDPIKDDGGILTAEAIAGLPLHHLELAVLSACETGLGEVAGGEGVFGLQRAFHLAGTQNVVASLWKVNDEATAALMALFYHKLWQENKPPLVALREAQLTLYHHPERIADLAKERGPSFEQTVGLPLTPTNGLPTVKAGDKAPVKLWAGFQLSGMGADSAAALQMTSRPAGVVPARSARPEAGAVSAESGVGSGWLFGIGVLLLLVSVTLTGFWYLRWWSRA